MHFLRIQILNDALLMIVVDNCPCVTFDASYIVKVVLIIALFVVGVCCISSKSKMYLDRSPMVLSCVANDILLLSSAPPSVVPRLLTTPQHVKVKVRQPALLECLVEGTGTHTITWYTSGMTSYILVLQTFTDHIKSIIIETFCDSS